MSLPRFPHLPSEAWELFLRDELSGSSLRKIESHLEACEDCRRSLEQADPSFLFRRLQNLPLRESVLEGLWDDVRAELPAASPAPDVASLRPGARKRERLGFLAGAATLLLAVLTLQALPSTSPDRRAQQLESEACVRLALSATECRDLFSDVRFDGEPTLFVEASADLTELL